MQKLTPQQIEEIVDANGEAYRRDIVKDAWRSRVHGMWAGSGLGMAIGAAIGVVVAAAGAIAATAVGGTAAAAITATGFFLPVIGAFALAGMTTGAAVMTSVNASAGAAVGLAKANDRRQLANEPATAENIIYSGVPEGKKTLANTLLPFNKGSKNVFNPLRAITLAAVAVTAGVAFLAMGGVPLLTAATGAIAGHIGTGTAVAAAIKAPAVAIAMALATAGSFGAIFGLDGPSIAANGTEFVSTFFRGGKKSAKPLQRPEASPCAPSVSPDEIRLLNERLAARETNFSQALAARQQQTSTSHLANGV